MSDKNSFIWECNEFWWCLNNIAKGLWKPVFIMCDLFNDIAKEVSCSMAIKYNEIEANNSLRF